MTGGRSRKLAKEGQRRSPRISALEAHGSSEESRSTSSGVAATHPSPNSCVMIQINNGGHHLQTTTATEIITKKRKLIRPPHQELTAIASASASSPLKTSSSTIFMPEKIILELVLDTLQRRDTYEIFAEPVDPNEVEDYYAIIEEPMDFGTIRAKLHEGMYKSLLQFEHDVFLIFNNAMHFNSSGTIYFKQARAINELARKVFDVLKTNPEKFELEFSETKRKVGRRNPGGFRDSSTDKKFSEEITIDASSNSVSCSSRGTSSHRKSFKANHGCSDIAKHIDGRDVEVHIGAKEHSSRYRSSDVDKRCTYRPPLSLNEDESIFSTVCAKLELLEHVNQQADDVDYRDSLMLFVKDLGPTAQNIAKRKLLGCEIRTAATTTCGLWRPQTNNEMMRSPNPKGKMHLQIAPGEETAYISDHGNHSSRGSFPNVWYHGSNVSQSRIESKCKIQSLPWLLESKQSQIMQESTSSKSLAMGGRLRQSTDADCLTHKIPCTSESMKISQPNHTIPLAASSFVFNLPYLKTRLDQINSSEQLSISQQNSNGKKRPLLLN